MQSNMKRYLFTKRQLIALVIMLSIEFILGVVLGTFAPYDSHNVSVAHTVTLDIHIAVGILLLSAAAVRLVLACMWHSLRVQAVIGLALMVGAFGSGEASIHGGGHAAVFSMAVCFLFAFLLYGQTRYKLKSQTSVGGSK